MHPRSSTRPAHPPPQARADEQAKAAAAERRAAMLKRQREKELAKQEAAAKAAAKAAAAEMDPQLSGRRAQAVSPTPQRRCLPPLFPAAAPAPARCLS